MSEYKYGMRLRGFSPGAQPKEGFMERQDGTGRYWDILVYNRPLTEQELADYELDDLQPCTTCDKMHGGDVMTVKEIRKITGLSQAGFAEKYGIPKRTIESWESPSVAPSRKPPEYLVKLLERVVKEDYGA